MPREDFSTMLNAGIEVTLGEKSFTVRALDTEAVANLQAYYRSQALRAYRMSLEGDTTVSAAERARREKQLAYERVTMADIFPQPTAEDIEDAKACPECGDSDVKCVGSVVTCQACKHVWTIGVDPDPVIGMRAIWLMLKGAHAELATFPAFQEWFRKLPPEDVAQLQSAMTVVGGGDPDSDPTPSLKPTGEPS